MIGDDTHPHTRELTPDLILRLLFYISLLARFVFVVFVFGPMHNITNDWGRHFDNGLKFFSEPTLMGGVDPKLYQLWIWVIHEVTGGDGHGIECFTGVLCALLPYAWYRAAGELFSQRIALLLGLFISLHPSFLAIYSYFMNETLLMPLFGFSIWMTLRAARTGARREFLICILLWTLTLHARMTVLPVMLLAVGWLLHKQQRPWLSLTQALLILTVVTIPAGLQSQRSLKSFVPFQSSLLNQVYFHNGNVRHEYRLPEGPYAGYYSWTSPSYYYNPLHPFIPYRTHREWDHEKVVKWNTTHGMRDLKTELARLKAEQPAAELIKNMLENTLFLFFSPSWPDSTNASAWHHKANYHARWIWPFCMVVVLLGCAFMPMKAQRAFVVSATLALIATLVFQQMGIMEGRYRKPLEPLLLFSVVIMWQSRRVRELEPDLYTPVSYGLAFYVLPLWRMVAGGLGKAYRTLTLQAFASP